MNARDVIGETLYGVGATDRYDADLVLSQLRVHGWSVVKLEPTGGNKGIRLKPDDDRLTWFSLYRIVEGECA